MPPQLHGFASLSLLPILICLGSQVIRTFSLSLGAQSFGVQFPFPSPVCHVLVFSGLLSVLVSLDFFCIVFFTTEVSAPIRSTLSFSPKEVPGLGLDLIVTDLWSQRRNRGARETYM